MQDLKKSILGHAQYFVVPSSHIVPISPCVVLTKFQSVLSKTDKRFHGTVKKNFKEEENLIFTVDPIPAAIDVNEYAR